MKYTIQFVLICLMALTLESVGQSKPAILQDLPTYPIKTINSSNDDFKDLQFLKEVLKDNRIVLLGEQSHREGATFEAKVRLIKFLHQELNYEIVSFESGLYDNYKAYEIIKDTAYRESSLKNSIYGIWSDTKEFEPLLKYVHISKNSSKPLRVTGFDSQSDNIFKDEFLSDIRDLLGSRIKLQEEEIAILEQVISTGPEFIVSDEKDSILFFSSCKKIQISLEELPDFDNNIRAKILKQSLVGWEAMVKWEMDILNEVDVKIQNPRDLQMARNLIFLSELYPDKKIIGWGASYHFANQIELYKNTDITQRYVSKFDSLEKSEEPTSLDKELGGAMPMGRILKDHFGSAIYSIAFSSFEGEFGMLGFPSTSMRSIQPPSESIEYELVKNGLDYAFVDYHTRRDSSFFYSSAIGNLPIFAPWQKLFDGLLLIKTSYAPSFPVNRTVEPDGRIKQSKIVPTPQIEKLQVKRVIDTNTKLGIPYASIYLSNTSKGVASNSDGAFIFNIPQARRNDKVILSSIGYKTDTLTVSAFIKLNKIELIPTSTQLAEFEFRSKPLRAKEIIKLAEKRISDNYYQYANQQEFFYRVKEYKEDSVILNEEASVLVYNPIGYQTKTASKRLKGQILQFRNTTNNADDKNSWFGIGSLWLVYGHDLILDKHNVLHLPAYYDLTLNGITFYENKKVYDIVFDCKKTGAYTTGFGYPSPLSASGRIFIDVNTYAVLKFETLIQRQPYKSKRRPNLMIDPYGHQLVQIYKEFNGKYFLNYSKQVHFGKWTNIKTKRAERTLEIRELLSTDIITKPNESMTISLTNIKSVPVKVDLNFWQNHNLKIEDNLADSYIKLGLQKN